MNCDEFGDGLDNEVVINREKDPVNSQNFGVNRRSKFGKKVNRFLICALFSISTLFSFSQENGTKAKFNGKNTHKKIGDNTNGYVSAMFRNNPQVPVAIFNKTVDVETVNKNKTSLFSTSTYKDLTDLHPHMVSTSSVL